MKVAEARLAFKLENFVTPTVKLNTKSDRIYKSEGYLCDDCKIENLNQQTSSDQLKQASELKLVKVRTNENIEGQTHQYKGYIDSQNHILFHCVANDKLRKGKQLNKIEDCVLIFKEVIARRNKQSKAKHNIL